jgi:hypothetical protein
MNEMCGGASNCHALVTRNAWHGLMELAYLISPVLPPLNTMAALMEFRSLPPSSFTTVAISPSPTLPPEDVLVCFGEIQQIHWKVLQSWYNPRTLVSGPSIERILDRGFQAFPKLRTLDIQDAVEFYDKFQELSHSYLLPLMPFKAVHLGNNFEGLYVPGLDTQRYHECVG